MSKGFKMKAGRLSPAVFIKRPEPDRPSKSMPDMRTSPVVKSFLDSENALIDLVEEHDCKIILTSGEVVTSDWWYDFEGWIPEEEKHCSLPDDVSNEIERLHSEYIKLQNSPEVKAYEEQEYQRRRHARQIYQQRFKEAVRKCASGSHSDRKACLTQHLE